MTIQKTRCVPVPAKHYYAQTALLALGISRNRLYFPQSRPRKIGYFWNRPYGYLVDLFNDAKKLYHRRMKQIHPDKQGNHDLAVELTRIWQRIKYLYRRHGIHVT